MTAAKNERIMSPSLAIKHSLDERLDAFPHNCDSGTVMFRSTKAGRAVINRRRAKGRKRLAVQVK
jgi:hypothetical protein